MLLQEPGVVQLPRLYHLAVAIELPDRMLCKYNVCEGVVGNSAH
jgi:hypothetical protein